MSLVRKERFRQLPVLLSVPRVKLVPIRPLQRRITKILVHRATQEGIPLSQERLAKIHVLSVLLAPSLPLLAQHHVLIVLKAGTRLAADRRLVTTYAM